MSNVARGFLGVVVVAGVLAASGRAWAASDLVVTNIVASETPIIIEKNQSWDLRVTVKNNGPDATTGFGFRVGVKIGSYSCTKLLSSTVSGGATKEITFSASELSSCRPAGPGTYAVETTVDVNREITESNENNNTLTKSFKWSQIDLLVTDAEVRTNSTTGTSYWVGDREFTFTAQVKNAGDTALPSTDFPVSFALDGKDCGRGNAAGYAPQPGNTAGFTLLYTSVKTACLPVTNGNHSLVAVVDPDNALLESNEGNNKFTTTLAWLWPDLTISEVTLDTANPVVGTPVKIRGKIVNAGDRTKEFTADGKVFATVTQFYLDGVKCDEVSGYGDVAAGGSTVPWTNEAACQPATPGPHVLRVVADATDRHFESNENNNTREATFTWVATCTASCAGKVCGDNGCGGSCGGCPGGQSCDASGQCVGCTPSCAGRVCGDNGCGGSCGGCPGGQSCDASGQCVDAADPCTADPFFRCCDFNELYWCVDGKLTPGACAPDYATCGWWEGDETSPADYYCGGWGADPSGNKPKGCSFCEPSCGGRSCGDDGCGGSCGNCASDAFCTLSGQCMEGTNPCTADPAFRCCDSDTIYFCYMGLIESYDCSLDSVRCGWVAGDETYPPDYYCGGSGADPSGSKPLQCGFCAPSCAGRACGDDGCGGSCGTCGWGTDCIEGTCITQPGDDLQSADVHEPDIREDDAWAPETGAPDASEPDTASTDNVPIEDALAPDTAPIDTVPTDDVVAPDTALPDTGSNDLGTAVPDEDTPGTDWGYTPTPAPAPKSGCSAGRGTTPGSPFLPLAVALALVGILLRRRGGVSGRNRAPTA